MTTHQPAGEESATAERECKCRKHREVAPIRQKPFPVEWPSPLQAIFNTERKISCVLYRKLPPRSASSMTQCVSINCFPQPILKSDKGGCKYNQFRNNAIADQEEFLARLSLLECRKDQLASNAARMLADVLADGPMPTNQRHNIPNAPSKRPAAAAHSSFAGKAVPCRSTGSQNPSTARSRLHSQV